MSVHVCACTVLLNTGGGFDGKTQHAQEAPRATPCLYIRRCLRFVDIAPLSLNRTSTQQTTPGETEQILVVHTRYT